ncbi:hypothetical protein C0J52_09045 [Blattella germanica]|nr:hypothetical protein C0J52_09045 [Blattella germanica]
MTRHKTPKSLEALTLDAIGNFVLKTGRRLVLQTPPTPPPTSKKLLDYIGINRRLKKEQEEWQTQQNINLDWLHDYIYSGIPLELTRKVVTSSLEAVNKFAKEMKCTHEQLSWSSRQFHKAFILRMLINSIIDPNLSLLHLSPVRWNSAVGQILWQNVHKMPKLEILEFSIPTHLSSKEILHGIQTLQNLISFTMRRCTDRILVAVVKNCPQMEYLDVCSSPEVTDASIDYILKLKKLKELLFYHTAITKKGLTRILKGIGNWGCNLEDGQTRRCGLMNFHAGRPSAEHLNLLASFCPFLTSVRLSHVEGDMSILSVLNDLIEIEIIHGNFMHNNFKGLLKVTGSNLKTLVLIKMKDIDINFICESCVNLKTLVLLRGSSTVDIEILRTIEPTPLQQLEYLVLDATCPMVFIEHLLSLCINIKRIQIGHTDYIDDDSMATVFETNPMSLLEMIIIISSTNALSMRTVSYLINNCPNIYLLGDLREWYRITPQEIQEFQEEIKSSNLDVTLALNLLEKSSGNLNQESDESFLGSHVLR